MLLLLCLAALVAAVWGAVIYRQLTIMQASWIVLLTGTCIGYDFFHRSVGPLPITIDRLIWGAMLAHFAWVWLRGKTAHRRLSPLDLLLILFALSIAFNLVITDSGYNGRQPVATFLFFVLMPIGSYLIVRLIHIERRDDQAIFWGAIGLGTYLALTAVAETRGWTGLVFPRYISDPEYIEFLGRGRGPFMNPVANGLVMTFCLIIGGNRWSDYRWKGKAALACFALVMLAGCYSTLTRTVWLGTAFACGNWLFWNVRWERRIALAAFGALAVGLFVGGALDYVKSFKRDKHVTVEEMEQSARLRPLLASVALRMVADRPLQGHGFGQYLKTHEPYHYNGSRQFWEDGTEPWQLVHPYVQHNLWLSLLVDLGIFSALIFAIVIAGWCWQSVSILHSERLEDWQRRYGLVTMTLISSYLINGMFHDVFIIPMANMFVFSLAGASANFYASAFAQVPKSQQVVKVNVDQNLSPKHPIESDLATS